VIYEAPAVENRQPIAEPFVLGTTYVLSPTWTDQPDEDDRSGS
jgi:hypothetical protein